VPDRSTQFATFTVERDIAFPPAAVFRAFADIDAKRRWFGDPEGTDTEHALDFRVGGLEHSSGGSPEAGGTAACAPVTPRARSISSWSSTVVGSGPTCRPAGSPMKSLSAAQISWAVSIGIACWCASALSTRSQIASSGRGTPARTCRGRRDRPCSSGAGGRLDPAEPGHRPTSVA